MKVSRRKFIGGMSAAAVLRPTPSKAWRHGKQTGLTSFVQGALGGGGFANNLSSSPNGALRYVTGNTPNLYRWRASTGKWDNNSTSPAMDALGIKPMGGPGTVDFVAVGPDNLRVYMVCACIGADQHIGYINTGGGQQGLDHGQLYRSDNGGDSWFRPGGTVGGALTTPFDYGSGGLTPFGGPRIVVDPNNKDIVWGMMYHGIVWVSFNGGVTKRIVRALADLTLLTTHATANVGVGVQAIPVTSNPIFGQNDYAAWGIYDADNPFAFGGASFGGGDMYNFQAGADATHVSGLGIVQSNNPVVGVPASFGDPGVVSGDQLYFGQVGCLAIDGASGTVANPGIALGDPGATGVASKVVYFCWCNGNSSANKVWWTQNAGGSLSSGDFAAITGSPTLDQGASTYKKMKISHDAQINGSGGNALYLVDNMNNHDRYYRFVGAIPPTGSGISANTWATFTSQQGSGCSIVACDYFTAGAFTLVNQQAGYRPIFGYGASPGTLNTSSYTFAGDTPWLNTGVDVVLSDAEFDPNVANKIWLCDGVGIYWFTQNNTNSPYVLNQNMQQMESYIVVSVLKTPAPNGNLFLTGEDRPQVTITDTTVVPPRYFPNASTFVGNGYFCEYARDNPNNVYFSKDGIYRNASGGIGGTSNVNWSRITTNKTLTRGVIASLGLGGGGSGYANGTYTNVPMIGGSGTGATGTIVVAGNAVTSCTITNQGSLYANGEILGVNASAVGGSGSGFFCGANVNGAFQTVSGSPTVTVSSPAHGWSTGNFVGWPFFTAFNGINLQTLRTQVTVIDADHYTVVSPVNATATGSGGGNNGSNGGVEGARGWSGGAGGNMCALTSTQLFVVCDSGSGGPWNIQYGSSPDAGVTWNWQQTLYGGNPILGIGGNPFIQANFKPVDLVDGVIWYLDLGTGSPTFKTLFKSTDGGQTLTVPGTVGNYPGGLATGAGCRGVKGNAGHVLCIEGPAGLGAGLFRTRNGGVSWETMANCQIANLLAVGPNVISGRPYPSVYVVGQCNGVSNVQQNIFRCDDMSPSTTACTWTQVSGLEKANCDGLQDICCDPDVPGKFYLGTYDTGYVVATYS